MFFLKFESNFLLGWWLDCEQCGKNQYKKKGHNQQFSVQSVMITFTLFKCHRFMIHNLLSSTL